MKKIIHYFLPLLFALVLFFFYIIIYPSPVESKNFATAVLLFFVGLGGSAVIIFPQKKNKFLFYLYISVSLGFPPILMYLFSLFSDIQHKIIFGFLVVGLAWLKFFVSAYLNQQSKE